MFPRNFPRVCDDEVSGADDDGDGVGAERNLPRRGAAKGAGAAFGCGGAIRYHSLFLLSLDGHTLA